MEKAEKKEKSWELLRECTNFLKQNEKNWKVEADRPRLKKKQEDKNRRLELAKMQKEDTLRRLKQQKIIATWKKLPEHERRQFLAEEDNMRRSELRETKINIWKKWRAGYKKMRPKPDNKKCLEDSLLERLEENLGRMKTEALKRNAAKSLQEEKERN